MDQTIVGIRRRRSQTACGRSACGPSLQRPSSPDRREGLLVGRVFNAIVSTPS